jgi:hypothetical protein
MYFSNFPHLAAATPTIEIAVWYSANLLKAGCVVHQGSVHQHTWSYQMPNSSGGPAELNLNMLRWFL